MQPCSGSFDYTQLIDRGRGPEHANTFCARQRLVQQLKLLGKVSMVFVPFNGNTPALNSVTC